MTRPVLAMAIAGVASIAALWIVPPVGFVAVVVMLVVVPPWGRTLSERGVISGVVVLGLASIVFPRAGSTPVSAESARLAMSGLVVLAVGLRGVPRLRSVPVPRPRVVDAVVGTLVLVAGWWLTSAYLGQPESSILSGLYFSGWDNEGHFTTFANTYAVGSTTWPTSDGSVAWNQWYPSLHTTVWALAEYAIRPGEALARTGLLWPFVMWNAATFAACLGALSWLAGDLASRLSAGRHRWAAPLAAAGFAIFGLLGSPAFLFNKGFTNFLMGVTIVATMAWLTARSRGSALTLGWFLIPLGAVAVIGLWTPLVLGLVPSGIAVAVVLLRDRLWRGIAWLVAVVVAAAVLAVTQSQAILGAEGSSSAGDFATSLGQVGRGMAAFNLGAALLSPLVVLLLTAVLVRQRRWLPAVGVLGPTFGAGVLAVVFSIASDSAGISRTQSYYVLKCLDALLISAVPLVAALAAIAICRALVGTSRFTAAAGMAVAGLVALGMFGYVGVINGPLGDGFVSAPGVQAANERTHGVSDNLVGVAILGGVEAVQPYPGYTPLLWDGSGLLPNLWTATLSGVVSKKQNVFYGGLPQFPYDDKAVQYVNLALNLDADLRVAVLWFRPSSGELLDAFVQQRTDDRVVLSKVEIPPGPLCPECTP